MNITLLSDRRAKEWDTFVAGFDDATLYHHHGWYDVLADTYGHEKRLLTAYDGEDRIVGVLPMMLVKLPVLGAKLIACPYQASAGPPLANDDEVFSALVEAAIEMGREADAKFVEIRGPANDARMTAAGFDERHGGTFDSIIRMHEVTRSTIHRGHRQDLNRVNRLGIEIREATSLAEWRTFYEMFELLQREFAAIGLGWAIFENLFLKLPSKAKVRLARLDGEVIAGAFLLCHHKTIFSKQAVVMPDHVRTGVGKGLVWSTMEWGKSAGYDVLNLGISLQSQTHVLKFKEGFNATARPLSSYVYALGATPPSYEDLYEGYGTLKKMWKKMPLPATKLAGAMLTRWFC